MLNFLSILIIAVLGIDRIDFFRGDGPFILTPFLLLSPILLFVLMINFFNRPNLKFRVDLNGWTFYLLMGSILSILLLSLLFSNDVSMSAKRMVLLMYQIIVLVVFSKMWCPRILLKGAYIGFFIFMLFNIILTANWIYLHTGLLTYIDFGPIFDLTPITIGPLTTRFCGFARDPNYGTFFLGVFFYIIYKYGKNSLFYKLIIFLLIFSAIFSLSKSGGASFFLMILFILCTDRKHINYKATISIVFLSAFFMVIFLIFLHGFSLNQYSIDIIAIAKEITSVGEGTSGGTHLILLSRGVDVAFDSIKNLLLGVGIFAPQEVLFDIFPEEYANFHSIYMSFLAESGLISLMLFLLLLFYPFAAKSRHSALIVLIAMFGIFYQVHLSPIFWWALILVWKGIQHCELVTGKSCGYNCYS